MASTPIIGPSESLPGISLSTPDPRPATPTDASTTLAESSVSAPTTSSPSSSSSVSPAPLTLGPGPVSTPMPASSHKNHAGAIAGGVVGGVALITAIIALIFFLCYRRARSKRHASRSSQKWDGFSSAGNNGHLTVANLPGRHASTASTAPMVPHDDIGRKVSTSTSHMSDGDHTTLADDEKVPSTPSTLHGHKPFELIETVPPLPSLDAIRPPSAALVHGDGFTFPKHHSRARSTSENRAAALAKLDPTVSAPLHSPTSPSAPIWKRQSMDIRALMGSTEPLSPISPRTAEMIKLNRTSSAAKRTTRKAVPKYDESDFTSTSPTSSSLPETHTLGREMRKAAAPSASSSHSNLAGRSKEDLQAAGYYDVPELNHKSSFGDMRPVHYLIPDMPPPQKD